MLTPATLTQIRSYTAWRYGCDPALLELPGVHVIPALPPPDANLLAASAASEPGVLSVTRFATNDLSAITVVRMHPAAPSAVRDVVTQMQVAAEPDPRGLAAGDATRITRRELEPYLYVDAAHFRPFTAGIVRPLTVEDAPPFAALHAAIPPDMRWFVELEHAALHGCFADDTLAAVASLFLFDEQRVAAAGVLTHPDYRRQGYGKAVVAAVVEWALARNYICEWSTWEANAASYRLAAALGFQDYLSEIEYEIEGG